MPTTERIITHGKHESLFLFLDVETTGLNPLDDSIIEIAWAFTDKTFTILGEPKTFMVEPKSWGDLMAAFRETPAVKDMHRKSGLFAELTTLDLSEISWVRTVLAEDISLLPEHGALHLAGFSVHFDRSFLAANGFNYSLERIHHRHYDLSSVRLGLDTMGISYKKPVNANPHRAMTDVFESIEQARLWADAAAMARVS